MSVELRIKIYRAVSQRRSCAPERPLTIPTGSSGCSGRMRGSPRSCAHLNTAGILLRLHHPLTSTCSPEGRASQVLGYCRRVRRLSRATPRVARAFAILKGVHKRSSGRTIVRGSSAPNLYELRKKPRHVLRRHAQRFGIARRSSHSESDLVDEPRGTRSRERVRFITTLLAEIGENVVVISPRTSSRVSDLCSRMASSPAAVFREGSRGAMRAI